jgi:hypothetical protein
MEIIQVVPQFAPVVNGLGDYALLLAQELRTHHRIKSTIIVGDPDWANVKSSEEFVVEPVANRTASALLQVLEMNRIETILLHYVGYGYAKRGCPFWLFHGLKHWKHRQRDRRLITIFHEIYAKGAIWNSSFWNSRFQKSLARNLASIADHCYTPIRMYEQTLRSFRPRDRHVTMLPMFSTIGEPTSVAPISDRKREMVVFGGAALRRAVYTVCASHLIRASTALRIQRIVDIGPPTGLRPKLPLPVEHMGLQSSEAIRDVLSNSMAGFISYFDGYLAKSSVLAAYCAHGVIPVTPTRNASEADGLSAGEQYLSVTDLSDEVSINDAQRISDNALRWYKGHSISQTATILKHALIPNSGKG